MKDSKTAALLLAGGSGTRAGGARPKQERNILGKSVLRRAAEAFETANEIDGFYIIGRADEEAFAASQIQGMRKYLGFAVGGDTRAESAKIGFSLLEKNVETVVIHDVARPLIQPKDIDKVVREAKKSGAAVAVLPIYDTVKEISPSGEILHTLPRASLVRAATPQAFSVENYKKALTFYAGDETDDAVLAERAGILVKTVTVGSEAVKITTDEDFRLAEYLISEENQ